MNKKQSIFAWTIAFSVFLSGLGYCDEAQIVVVSGRYKEDCLMTFTLTPSNTSLNIKPDYVPDFLKFLSKKRQQGDFVDGFFLVYVPRGKFPLRARNYTKFITLIMPKTEENEQKNQFVAEKKALFDKITQMVNSGTGSVEVILDLNKYVQIVKKEPHIVELEDSVVYFRDVNGQYIGHTNAVTE